MWRKSAVFGENGAWALLAPDGAVKARFYDEALCEFVAALLTHNDAGGHPITLAHLLPWAKHEHQWKTVPGTNGWIDRCYCGEERE